MTVYQHNCLDSAQPSQVFKILDWYENIDGNISSHLREIVHEVTGSV